jgi:hypothetical protein
MFLMNIILVTSIINTPQTPLSYTNIRSVYNRQERFDHMKHTIKNVKEKIPNSYVVLVECSELSEEEKAFFYYNVDLFVNIYNNEEVREMIYSASKSYGEGMMTIHGIRSLLKQPVQWNNFFKITGRYWLSDNFNFEKYNNDYSMVKCIESDKQNVYTCLYKLNRSVLIRWYYYLQKQEKYFQECANYEIIFGRFLEKIHENKRFIKNLGISGFVATTGDLITA